MAKKPVPGGRRRRRVAATELRVHLGEALRALENEDLVIEKGGVPVAMLVRYEPLRALPSSAELDSEYERSVVKPREPGGYERMLKAMEAGWSDIDTDELVANIHRWREEGSRQRPYTLDEDDSSDEGETDGGDVPAGQQYLYRGDAKTQRIAERDGPRYDADGGSD